MCREGGGATVFAVRRCLLGRGSGLPEEQAGEAEAGQQKSLLAFEMLTKPCRQRSLEMKQGVLGSEWRMNEYKDHVCGWRMGHHIPLEVGP